MQACPLVKVTILAALAVSAFQQPTTTPRLHPEHLRHLCHQGCQRRAQWSSAECLREEKYMKAVGMRHKLSIRLTRWRVLVVLEQKTRPAQHAQTLFIPS
eukprot:5656334-Amphidinium_carterae.2